MEVKAIIKASKMAHIWELEEKLKKFGFKRKGVIFTVFCFTALRFRLKLIMTANQNNFKN